MRSKAGECQLNLSHVLHCTALHVVIWNQVADAHNVLACVDVGEPWTASATEIHKDFFIHFHCLPDRSRMTCTTK